MNACTRDVFGPTIRRQFKDGRGNIYFAEYLYPGGTGAQIWRAKRNEEPGVFMIKQYDNTLDETWEAESEIQGNPLVTEHYNILPLESSFKCGPVEERSYFIVTSLCQGGTLKDEALRTPNRVLTEMKIRVFGLQILSGLAHLRRRNVVHNDLKPSNVFLTKEGEGIRIADFGQANTHLETDDEEPILERNPDVYAAPEQRGRSKQGSFPVDVWSLGVMFFELLLGVKPELDKSPNFATLSPACQDIISEMLTINPKDRPTPETLLTRDFFTQPALEELQQTAHEHNQANEDDHVVAVGGESAEQSEKAEENERSGQEGSTKHQRDEVEVAEGTCEGSWVTNKRPCLQLHDSDIEYFSDISEQGVDDEVWEWGAEEQGAPVQPPAEVAAGEKFVHDDAGEGDIADDEAGEASEEDAGEDVNQRCSEDESDAKGGKVTNGDENDEGKIPEGISQYVGFEDELDDYGAMKKEGQRSEIKVIVVRDEKSFAAHTRLGYDSYTSVEDEGDMVEVPPY
ncbi:Cell cycle serine/threonine-protein kinase cdc5/MSD2 [Mortierella sp. 14UC]|nr:Cell cycle serine/threonine-protein kinase cdc5/MSD2 [Mortierella sp. 14UC]